MKYIYYFRRVLIPKRIFSPRMRRFDWVERRIDRYSRDVVAHVDKEGVAVMVFFFFSLSSLSVSDLLVTRGLENRIGEAPR